MENKLSRYGIRQTPDEPEIDEESVEFQKLLEVVSAFEKSDKYFKKFTSYKLKHILENYLKDVTNGEINYIGNGELIRAMQIAGFKWIGSSSTSRNAFLNFTSNSLKPFESYMKCF